MGMQKIANRLVSVLAFTSEKQTEYHRLMWACSWC